MEKFNESAPCPKCGEQGEPKVSFVAAHQHAGIVPDGFPPIVPECLVVTCRRCGYVYKAACKDAK